MSLVMFSSRATAPFIMFEETAKAVLKAAGEPWAPEGGFDAQRLPEVIAKLEAAIAAEKMRLAQAAKEREERLRSASYDEELRARAQEEEEERARKAAGKEIVHLYQRIAPLLDMMRRSLASDDAVIWGKP